MSFVALLKIVHLELFPNSSAVLVLSMANAAGYTVRSFFLFSSAALWRGPLSWPSIEMDVG